MKWKITMSLHIESGAGGYVPKHTERSLFDLLNPLHELRPFPDI